MSECMGLLSGTYDAKTGGGFQAGGMSLHNIMAGHGPDADAHDRVSPISYLCFKVPSFHLKSLAFFHSLEQY